MGDRAKLTLGPVLFDWPPEEKRDFYLRVAEEAPVDVVYLGEVVSSQVNTTRLAPLAIR